MSTTKKTEDLLDQYETAIIERTSLDEKIQELRAALMCKPEPEEAVETTAVPLPTSTPKAVPNPIRAYRESQELSQVEAGEACGVSGQTIGSWERFESFPREGTIGELPRGWKRAARDLAAMA